MAGILSGFSGFGGYTALLKYGVYFVVFLVIAFSITAIVLMLLFKLKQTKIIEITPTRRLSIYSGRYKKRKGSDIKQFFSRKLGRFMPQFQETDKYAKGKQDALILYKDNNGMHNSLRVPTWKQIKRWYDVQYGIDLDDTEKLSTHQSLIRSIYFEPTPHESLDWLATQVTEAEKEYKDLSWWQHPNFMIAASVAGAAMIQIVNLVFLYLMNKK
jgi:uncharacterized membrane protein